MKIVKKKKWIVLWFGLVAVLVTASVAYHRLSMNYEQEEIKQEEIEKDGQKQEVLGKEDTQEESVNVQVQRQADDITVYDENSNEVKLSDYFGKPLVVNFWASWCPPCKREMPLFQEAINTYGEQVTFLMINETDGERETMETAQAFLKNSGYEMKVLFDLKGDAGSTYNLLYLPRTLFIDENGKIVEDCVGELSETKLSNAMEKLLVSD